MKNKFFLFICSLFILFSCNSARNQSNADTIGRKEMIKQYDILLQEKENKDTYDEIIPLLESSLNEFKESDTLYNKIKLELASYYILEYLMENNDSSFYKAKQMLACALEFDVNNEFFERELSFDGQKTDSLREIIKTIEKDAKGERFLFETLNQISSEINK